MSLRSVATALVLAALAAGCSTSAREIREARNSGYRTDFAIVYNAALEATKKRYPRLREDARAGIIRTAWHPVRIQAQTAESSSDNPGATATGTPLASQSGIRKYYYVRFRVYVVGGHPWRVRIEGEASSWETGAVPTPLKGAEQPPWLRGKVDSLRVAIHKKLKKYAVKLESTEKKPVAKAKAPPPDTKAYAALPPKAAKVIAAIAAAARARDLDTIRSHLTQNFAWASGSEGADTAMAMFSADSTLLEAMGATLASGCAARGAEIVCPAGALEPGYQGYFARFGVASGDWKMVSFFRSGE